MIVSTNVARKSGIVCKASYLYKNDKINAMCSMLSILPLLEQCSSVWISVAAIDLSPLDTVACSYRLLFPNNSDSYDLYQLQMISCLLIFQSLSSLISELLLLPRATRFTE